MRKTKRPLESIGVWEQCLNCSDVFGTHSWLACPTVKHSEFFGQKDADIALLSMQTPSVIMKKSELGVLPGPRKPAPAIPPEIHSSKPFDPQAAWEAVKALSKGS